MSFKSKFMLFDDATSILHTVVVIPGADISPSIVVGIWQTAVDIIRGDSLSQAKSSTGLNLVDEDRCVPYVSTS
jgi:hypothetical protein